MRYNFKHFEFDSESQSWVENGQSLATTKRNYLPYLLNSLIKYSVGTKSLIFMILIKNKMPYIKSPIPSAGNNDRH